MSFISELLVRIRGDKTQLDSTLTGAESSLNSFGSVVKKIGGIIGVAFGVQQIVSFIKEASRVAAEAEGIRNAFQKIADTGFLSQLKEATRGQLGSTELMKMAVQAQNLNIPLKDLPTYLDFATKRAITTGQSIRDMCEAIITGIGRQSPRAFLQLGISVDEFHKKVQELGGDKRGAILALVNKGLEDMGKVADDTAQKIGALGTAWENFKKTIGNSVNKEGGVLNELRKYVTTGLNVMADPDYDLGQKLSYLLPGYGGLFSKSSQAEHDAKKDARLQKENFDYLTGSSYTKNPLFNSSTQPTEVVKTLADLNVELKVEQDYLQTINSTDVVAISLQTQKINKMKEYITLLESGMANPNILKGATKIQGIGGGAGSALDQALSPDIDMSLGSMNEPDVVEPKALFDAPKQWEQEWKTAAKDVSTFISDELTQVFEDIGKGSFKGFGQDLVKNFGQLLVQLGKMLISLGTTMLLAQTLLKTPSVPTAIMAIAAGAAAIAIGGAMMGAASSGGDAMASGSSVGSGGTGYSSQNSKITVEGYIKGQDIFITNNRYTDTNNRST